MPAHDLNQVANIKYTSDEEQLKNADIYIVTVPTPINDSKQPNLNPLIKAGASIGRAIKLRSSYSDTKPIIIYGTVYPGATEEVCVPIIEKSSGLTIIRTFIVNL